MKKIFLSFLFFSSFLISTCLAQTNQGSVLLGGSINLSSYHESKKDDFSPFNFGNVGFNISPTVGYFVANRVAVGSSIGFNYSQTRYNSDIFSRGIGFSVAPFVRYYKLIGDKVAIFGSGSVNYARYTSKGLDDQQSFTLSYKQTDYGTAFTPGLTYFVSSKIGLEATLGSIGFGKKIQEDFQTRANPYPSENTNTDFRAHFGLSYSSLGIYFYLNR